MHIHQLFCTWHLSGLAAGEWAIVPIPFFLVVHMSDYVPVAQAVPVAIFKRGNKASTAKRAVWKAARVACKIHLG